MYSITMMGQNDVMAIMFFLLGWWLLAKSKIAASIIFGLSASIKMYPLIWLPFLLLPTQKLSLKEKIVVVLSSIGVYVATLAPFISNQVFRESVLNSSINDRFFVPQIDLGYSDVVYLIPLLLLIAVYGASKLVTQKDTSLVTLENQSASIMTANIILLGFSHFHPQWFTWVIPFWALWLVLQKKTTFQWTLLVSCLSLGAWAVIILLFKDAYLSQGIFVPLYSAFSNVPIIRDLLINKGFDVLKYNNLAHTWLAGVALGMLVYLFAKKTTVEKDHLLNIQLPALPFPKVVRFILVATLGLVATFCVIVTAHLLPIPQSSAPPEVSYYQPLTTEMTFLVTPAQENWYRVDITFRNPNLENNDAFTLTVLDSNSTIITQQPFSGFNTGDPGIIRFDLPPQAESKMRTYTIHIARTATAVTDSATQLEIGITETDELAIKSYYQPSLSFQSTISQAASQFLHILKQVPWLYLLILVALFLSL